MLSSDLTLSALASSFLLSLDNLASKIVRLLTFATASAYMLAMLKASSALLLEAHLLYPFDAL